MLSRDGRSDAGDDTKAALFRVAETRLSQSTFGGKALLDKRDDDDKKTTGCEQMNKGNNKAEVVITNVQSVGEGSSRSSIICDSIIGSNIGNLSGGGGNNNKELHTRFKTALTSRAETEVIHSSAKLPNRKRKRTLNETSQSKECTTTEDDEDKKDQDVDPAKKIMITSADEKRTHVKMFQTKEIVNLVPLLKARESSVAFFPSPSWSSSGGSGSVGGRGGDYGSSSQDWAVSSQETEKRSQSEAGFVEASKSQPALCPPEDLNYGDKYSFSDTEAYHRRIDVRAISTPKKPRPPFSGGPVINQSKNKSDRSNSGLDSMCMMCLNAPKNGGFAHSSCLHICCCYKCAVKLWNKRGRCPICNCKVKQVMKLFVV